jgi:predicted RNase H-like HicB family nuclease
MTTYTAVCEREGDWWVVTVPELDSGRVTQARSLDEVPATVADLVALLTGADPDDVDVTISAHVGPGPGVGELRVHR